MATSATKNSEIRIYPSFTEVREDVTASAPYVVYLQQDLYNQIMPGSLSLEGLNVLSMNAILRDNNLEGKTLHFRSQKDNQVRSVQVIRGRDLLVQDLETKRYFHAGRENLEFSEVPEETGTEVTFVLEKPGDAVLSYLMYGINWTPRYNFNIGKDSHDFQGWADINNNTQREYSIDNTELIGGDVSTVTSGYGGGRYQAEACSMAFRSDSSHAAPQIQSEGEQAGLYVYRIKDHYVLAAKSTFSLPFAQPKITLERVATQSEWFSQSNRKGKFSRVYRISSSEFLPAGAVTVREDGRVVGQSRIPDLSQNESNDLNVGTDSDVDYEREVKIREATEDFTTYEVVVKINNKKTRDVRFEYEENLGDRHELLESEPNLEVKNNSFKHDQVLAAKGNASIRYVVKIYNHDVIKIVRMQEYKDEQ